MSDRKTAERAERAERQGKSSSTQAGEFVREEMHHIREGKHGARSPKQAIAIGLSKARRAGVELKPPEEGRASEQTRKKAQQDLQKGKEALGKAAGKRSPADRSAAARKAAATRKKTGRANPKTAH